MEKFREVDIGRHQSSKSQGELFASICLGSITYKSGKQNLS